MNHSIDVRRTAITLGAFFGGVHLLWSVLVLLGWGQGLLDFVFWAHMVDMQMTVGPFDGTAALTLVVVTSLVGYAAGYAFALLWNKMHR